MLTFSRNLAFSSQNYWDITFRTQDFSHFLLFVGAEVRVAEPWRTDSWVNIPFTSEPGVAGLLALVAGHEGGPEGLCVVIRP